MKKGKSKKPSLPTPLGAPSSRVSVDIKKADNGFVVSQWGDKGEKLFIAKTQDEATKIASKLLKVGG